MNTFSGKFSHSSMKYRNRRLVLNLIRRFGPISRADIARLTDLTKSTVSEITLFLLEKGVIKNVGVESKKGVGRRGILLDLNSKEFLVLGYDVGTLFSRVILTDLEGRILRKSRFDTRRGENLTAQIRDSVERIAEGLWDKVVGIGVGVPGMVDHETGFVIHSPNLSLKDFPMLERLKDFFPDKEIILDHNVKLMMIAEMEHGYAKDHENVLLVNLGPGIGSVFTSGGKLVRGAHNFTGEIGHISVVENGDVCSCGKRGCLETVAAAWGIVKRYERLSGRGVEGDFNTVEIASRARSGDEVALRVFEEAGEYLGKVIAQAVNIIDPEIVLISGGLSEAWDLMESAFERSFNEEIIVPLRGKIRVLRSKLGDLSTALGAATLAIDRFLDRVCL